VSGERAGATTGSSDHAALVAAIEGCLRQPIYFRDILQATSRHRYRDVLLAWSDIRSRHELARDEHGRYWLAER
jgi:hypothetical protein